MLFILFYPFCSRYILVLLHLEVGQWRVYGSQSSLFFKVSAAAKSSLHNSSSGTMSMPHSAVKGSCLIAEAKLLSSSKVTSAKVKCKHKLRASNSRNAGWSANINLFLLFSQ